MNSRIGRLYPATKVAVVLLVIILCMFTPGYYLQYAMLPAFFIISVLASTGRKFITTFFKSIVIIVLFIFIIQVCILKNEDSQQIWAFINFSQMGLDTSLSMTSKITGISSAVICFFQVTSVKDIMYSLEKANAPKKLVFVIGNTVQLIPQMNVLLKTITDAQRARGIETEGSLMTRVKAFVPMIGPLIFTSIQQTEERVLTLEARAFSSARRKTSLYEIKRTAADYIITGLCIVALLVYIFRGMI